MIRVFQLVVGQYCKILYKLDKSFKHIGIVKEINDNLNIAKIQFKDVNEKEKTQWFHLVTGKAVTLPKTGEDWAKEVDQTGKKAYFISVEPVYNYDILPEMDENYVPEDTEEAEDPDSNQNEKVTEIK